MKKPLLVCLTILTMLSLMSQPSVPTASAETLAAGLFHRNHINGAGILDSKPRTSPPHTDAVAPIPHLSPSSVTVPIPVNPVHTYYVSPAGDDLAPGSSSEAFLTIQKGVDTAQAGDVVYIRAGTYHELVNITNSGTADNYIAIKAAPGDECHREASTGLTECSVILDGTDVSVGANSCGSGIQCGGLFNTYYRSYLIFQGIEIRNTELSTKPYLAGFYSKGSDHIYIDNSRTENIGSSGIGIWSAASNPSNHIYVTNNTVVNAQNYDIYGASGNLGEEDISLDSIDTFEVAGNEVYNDPSIPGTPNNGDLSFNTRWAIGICAKSSSKNGKVYNNYVHDMPNPSFYVDAWKGGLNGTDALQNIQLFNNTGKSLSVAAECGGTVDGVWIYNNVLTKSPGSGISVSNTVGWEGAQRCNPGNGLRRNVYILENTVDETTDYDGSGIGVFTRNVENVVIKNNLVTFAPVADRDRGVGEILAAADTGQELSALLSEVDSSNNLIYGTPANPNWCPCKSWNNSTNSCDLYYVCRGIPEYPARTPTTGIYADPLYVSNNSDLHLLHDSPAIGSGADLSGYVSAYPAVQYDHEGNDRLEDGSYDIGAYEYVHLTVTINQASDQDDPSGNSTIHFTAIFSESVSDFAAGDVTLSGTAGPTTAIVTGSGANYTVAVSGMTGPGTVTAIISAGSAHDAAGNPNEESTSSDNTVTFQPSPAPTFADVPFTHPYHDVIEVLYQAGYTAGCNTNPLMYCPEAVMNRAESSVFVERGIHTATYDPPAPTSQVFADLGLDSWAAKWVNGLWVDQYTAGCGTNPLVYCPWQGHTRAEGCVFYLRMSNGADFDPPQPTRQTFVDVPLEAWYAKWVEAAYDAGLITACQTTPGLRFCPDGPLTRALAAYMMVQAKNLLGH